MDYIPDHRGTARFLRESDELLEIVTAAAEQGAEFLRDVAAPVDTGDYREHISVETGMDLLRGDRRAAFIVASAPHSAAQDFPHGRGGRHRQGGSRPLARTLGYLDAEFS